MQQADGGFSPTPSEILRGRKRGELTGTYATGEISRYFIERRAPFEYSLVFVDGEPLDVSSILPFLKGGPCEAAKVMQSL